MSAAAVQPSVGAYLGVLRARRETLAVAGVLALAGATRTLVLLLTPGYRPLFDAGDYARHAASIAAGHGYPASVIAAGGGPSAFRPPLYPYLLGGTYAIAGHGAGRVLGLLLGVVVVLLIWMVARAVWDPRVALIAATLAAVFPPLVVLDASLLSEPLFLVIEVALVATVLRARRSPELRWALFAGVLCAAAALTRENGALLVIPALAGVATRQRLRKPAVLLVSMLVTLTPWALRNADVFGSLVPVSTQTGYTLAGLMNDRAQSYPGYEATWLPPSLTARYRGVLRDRRLNEAELDARLRSGAVAYAEAHPLYTAKALALNTLRIAQILDPAPVERRVAAAEMGLKPGWSGLLRWSWLVLAAAALAAWALLPAARRGLPSSVWLMPVLLLLTAALAGASERYSAPLYPFTVLLAATLIARARTG